MAGFVQLELGENALTPQWNVLLRTAAAREKADMRD
jgi:hypothetical protein